MNTKISKTAIVALVVSIIAISLACVALYRKGVEVTKAELGADSVTGICIGGGADPVSQECNKDINYLNVTTLIVKGASSFTGAISTGAITTDAFTQGGGVFSSSTTSTVGTIAASYFDTENVIDFTANTGDTTLTLPASSTLSSFIPTAGDTRTVFIRNATTTAATDLTIAGGTGTALKNMSTSSALTIYGDTDGNNYGELIFIRKATGGDIVVMFRTSND